MGSSSVDECTTSSLQAWTEQDVSRWLHTEGFPRAAQAFLLLEVSGATLLSVCEKGKKEDPPFASVSAEEMKTIIDKVSAMRGAPTMRKSPSVSSLRPKLIPYEPASLQTVSSGQLGDSGPALIDMAGQRVDNPPKLPVGLHQGQSDRLQRFSCRMPPVMMPPGHRGYEPELLMEEDSHMHKVDLSAYELDNDPKGVLNHYLPSPGSPSVSSLQSWNNADPRGDLFRAGVAAVYLLFAMVCTAWAITAAHGRVPKTAPLPDLVLDYLPRATWSLGAVERIISVLLFSNIAIAIFHKHRLVLFRRVCAVLGTCYLLRCFTILFTSLPRPGNHLSCVPEQFHDVWERWETAMRILTSGGYSANVPKELVPCGDYLYSGHTISLTAFTMFIVEYTPPRFVLVHITCWVLSVLGMFLILLGHDHYSVDVILAFYITNRVFTNYHARVGLNTTTRSWLSFPVFTYMEAHVEGPTPYQYDTHFPLCKPIKRLLRKVTIAKVAAPPAYSPFPHMTPCSATGQPKNVFD